MFEQRKTRSSKFFLLWLAVAVAIGVVIAVLVVVPRATVPFDKGTAPSVVTGSGSEAKPAPSGGPPPREVEASGTGGRGARGSGIEGVASGGTTHSPPR